MTERMKREIGNTGRKDMSVSEGGVKRGSERLGCSNKTSNWEEVEEGGERKTINYILSLYIYRCVCVNSLSGSQDLFHT